MPLLNLNDCVSVQGKTAVCDHQTAFKDTDRTFNCSIC